VYTEEQLQMFRRIAFPPSEVSIGPSRTSFSWPSFKRE